MDTKLVNLSYKYFIQGGPFVPSHLPTQVVWLEKLKPGNTKKEFPIFKRFFINLSSPTQSSVLYDTLTLLVFLTFVVVGLKMRGVTTS